MKFGDFAENVAVRIDPAEAKTDIYVGLEHLDPESLHLKKWGHPSDVTGQKLLFKKALLNQRVGRLVYKDSSPISKALTTQVFYSFRDRILGDAYGGAQPNISPRDIEKYTIYVPKTGLAATEATVQAMVRSRDSAKDQLLASVHLVAVLRNMLVSEGGPVA